MIPAVGLSIMSKYTTLFSTLVYINAVFLLGLFVGLCITGVNLALSVSDALMTPQAKRSYFTKVLQYL